MSLISACENILSALCEQRRAGIAVFERTGFQFKHFVARQDGIFSRARPQKRRFRISQLQHPVQAISHRRIQYMCCVLPALLSFPLFTAVAGIAFNCAISGGYALAGLHPRHCAQPLGTRARRHCFLSRAISTAGRSGSVR